MIGFSYNQGAFSKAFDLFWRLYIAIQLVFHQINHMTSRWIIKATLDMCTLNVIGGWLEIGLNYHITVMFDTYNMGQQLDMKFYAEREHPSSSQQL